MSATSKLKGINHAWHVQSLFFHGLSLGLSQTRGSSCLMHLGEAEQGGHMCPWTATRGDPCSKQQWHPNGSEIICMEMTCHGEGRLCGGLQGVSDELSGTWTAC